jgi:acetyltransferase-like isoleucine patch superfamily enzyme
MVDRILSYIYRKLHTAETRRLQRQMGHVGSNVVIDPRTFVWSAENVRIGNDVQINGYTFVYGRGGVEIGDGVMIGANCVISSVSHPVAIADRSMMTESKVRLGARVWLGAGVVVLPGVEVGENSVVAAGSVVTKSLPANIVAAGVPAEVKRQLSSEELAGSPS